MTNVLHNALTGQAYALCQEIENLPASDQQTKCAALAVALMEEIERQTPAVPPSGSATEPSEAAIAAGTDAYHRFGVALSDSGLYAKVEAVGRAMYAVDFPARAPASPDAGGREPSEGAQALDALEDMWWQHAYPVDGYDTSRHSGGLSANEYAEEVLKAAGRIIRVKPNKEWYRLTNPEERAALSASPPAAPAERETREQEPRYTAAEWRAMEDKTRREADAEYAASRPVPVPGTKCANCGEDMGDNGSRFCDPVCDAQSRVPGKEGE